MANMNGVKCSKIKSYFHKVVSQRFARTQRFTKMFIKLYNLCFTFQSFNSFNLSQNLLPIHKLLPLYPNRSFYNGVKLRSRSQFYGSFSDTHIDLVVTFCWFFQSNFNSSYWAVLQNGYVSSGNLCFILNPPATSISKSHFTFVPDAFHF
jgi:hypothetical protein